MMVHGKIGDYEFMRSVEEPLGSLIHLNAKMQELFKQWHQLEQREETNPFIVRGGTAPAAFVGMARLFDDETYEEFRVQVRIAEAWAVAIFAQAAEVLEPRPELDGPINPYAVSLLPERWDEDGLFDGSGLAS